MTPRVRVGEVLQLQRRSVTVDPNSEYEEIGVRSFGKGIFHKESVTGVELGNKRVFRIEPGDLVLSNVFAWEGGIAVATRHEANKIGSHRFMTFTPRDDRIDPSWAAWFFLSEPGLELIGKASPGSAGRNRTLAIDRFEKLEIPLPLIDAQRQVATRLSYLGMTARELGTRQARVGLVADALAVSSCARLDLSEATKAQAGWRAVELGAVMKLAQNPVAVDASKNYQNLGIYSFGRGVFSKQDIDGSATSAKTLYRVQGGQFIYSRLFAFEGAYAAVPREFEGYFVSNEFPTFDPDPEQLDAEWLACYLKTPTRWSELAGSSKGLGVRRQRIPVDAILDYRVFLPPIEQQWAMVGQIEQLAIVQADHQRMRTRIESLVPSALNAEFSHLI